MSLLDVSEFVARFGGSAVDLGDKAAGKKPPFKASALPHKLLKARFKRL